MDVKPLDISKVDHLVIAGWTGRDSAAVEAHVRELADLGLPRPSRTPIFYRAAVALLTQAEEIEVVGNDTSGEVEFIILKDSDGLWVGLGSDHTDRALEISSVALSKQVCAKVVARHVWRFDDVAPHWEHLVLRSWVQRDAARVLYQEGPVTTMRDPRELIQMYESESGTLKPGTAMFCGTLATRVKLGPSAAFEMELDDPISNRRLRHRYRTTVLPANG